MLNPIVKTIDMLCGQEQAFTAFVNDLNSWWPRDKNSVFTMQGEVADDNTTRVELTHSNWEVFGDSAADMRAGYDSGWVGVFEQAYRNACTTP